MPRKTRNISSPAYPLPTAPKSNRMPARPNLTRPFSTYNCRQSTNARDAAVNGARARHSRDNGPTVTSNAPPDASLNPRANRNTVYSSGLTILGVSSNEFNSLPAS